MPLYDFSCRDCHLTFERLCRGSFSLEELSCPRCGGKNLKKLMSSFRTSRRTVDSATPATSSGCSTCSSSSCSSCGM